MSVSRILLSLIFILGVSLLGSTPAESSLSTGAQKRGHHQQTLEPSQHPRTNSLVENFHFTKSALTALEQQTLKEWEDELSQKDNLAAKKEAAIALALHYRSSSPARARDYLAFAKSQKSALEDDRFFLSMELYLDAKIKFDRQIESFQTELERLVKEEHLPWRMSKDCHEILMNLYLDDNANDDLLRIYESYTQNVPRINWEDKWIKQAALLYLEKKELKFFFSSLEILAERFPHTAESKWAFTQLSEATKVDQNSTAYSFTLDFLRKVYLNSSIDPTSREYVLEQLNRPVRKHSRSARQMLNSDDKIKFLLRLRNYSDVLKMARQSLKHSPDAAERKRSHLWEAHALSQLGEYAQALRLYANARDNLVHFDHFFQESYAKTLMKDGQYTQAAKEFRHLLRLQSSYRTRWYLFWSLMKSNQKNAALSLLNHNQPMFHPKNSEVSARNYWKSRLFPEKFHQTKHVINELHRDYYHTLSEHKEKKVINQTTLNQSDFTHLRISPKYQRSKRIISLISNFDTSLIHANPYHRFVSNPAVIHRIEKERQDHPINKRTWLNEQYFASIAYKSEIDLIGKNLGIDPLLLLAILKAESGFNPNAVSSVGARGIMQIMPYTAVKLSQRLEDSEFTLENLNSPIKSILYGTTYLSMLNRAFKNNMIATIAAYNAGPSVVQQWIMHCKTCRADEFVELIPFRETRNYVKKVLSYYTDFTDKLDKTPDLGHLQDLPKVTPDDLSGLF